MVDFPGFELRSIGPLELHITEYRRCLELERAVLVFLIINPLGGRVDGREDERESIRHSILVDKERSWHEALFLVVDLIRVGQLLFQHPVDVCELDVPLIIVGQVLE